MASEADNGLNEQHILKQNCNQEIYKLQSDIKLQTPKKVEFATDWPEHMLYLRMQNYNKMFDGTDRMLTSEVASPRRCHHPHSWRFALRVGNQ